MCLLLMWLPVVVIDPIAPGEVKVSTRCRESTRVSNKEVPTSIRGQTKTTRHTHTKTVHLPTLATRAGGMTPTRGAHAAQTSMANAVLTVCVDQHGALCACGFHPLYRHHLSPPSTGPTGHLPLLREQNAAAVCEMDVARLDLVEMRWLRVVQI
jgi:hypothetical protein